MSDIVRITICLTDIEQLAEVGRIKAEYIDGPQPASTAVGVAALAIPTMMLEIDAIAVC